MEGDGCIENGATTPCGGWLLGEMNCDGVVSFSDIDPFVLALSDAAGYAQHSPNCDLLNGGCNTDDDVDFDDIDLFMNLLGR